MLDSHHEPRSPSSSTMGHDHTNYGDDQVGPSGGSGVPCYHLKILVPAVAAGAIIGKGGETIAQLQKEAGARVKMSKANDFYPGKYHGLIDGLISAVESGR